MASAFSLRAIAFRGNTAEECDLPTTDRNQRTASIGDFQIDFVTHRVLVRDRERRLEDDEFEVLTYLLDYPTNVVTPRTRLARGVSPTPEFLCALENLRRNSILFQVAGATSAPNPGSCIA